MKLEPMTKDQHNHLLSLFLNGYASMCAHMDLSCQKGLTDAAPLAFSKWYHTAMLSDTILSPANIIAQDFPDTQEGTEYLYTLQPSEKDPTPENLEFKLLSYSVESHPLIEDLRTITNFCVPDRKMDEHLFFEEDDQQELLKILSHKHAFYLEYLTRLAWWLELFIFIPSIHTQKVQRSPYCDTFFSQSNQAILELALEAACDLAAERFSYSMDLDENITSPSFFRKLVTTPTEIDTIFIDFYNQVDVDIESIWETEPQNLTQDDKAIISSFLFTAIMLDKWFIFPLSNFFAIIRPISFNPIKYYLLVNNLSALLTMERNIGTELFTPPSYYALTSLGKFILEADAKEDEKYTFPKHFSHTQIWETLNYELERMHLEEAFYTNLEKKILTIHVSKKDVPDFWKTIEVETTTKLDQFCQDLCTVFSMIEDQPDYLLTVLDANNYPIDYSAVGSKRSINKTNHKTMENLSLNKGEVFFLSTDKTNQLKLEVLDTTNANSFILYPRIKAQSKKVSEFEKNDEIF
ncbi:MAG: hypothetical protein ACK5I7_00750 [Anaerotignum sp.]